MTKHLITRRAILRRWFALSAASVGLLYFRSTFGDAAHLLPLTPSCEANRAQTASATEGPFYTGDTPNKTNFRQDAPGEPFTLVGFVLTRDCRPIANALVDLWHADRQGNYDNEGFRLRGHQLTDAQGRFVFETIVPSSYGRRTPHYHVKVRPQGGRMLTTQLYFPGEPRNERDFLFDTRLVMNVEAAADGQVGRFDFVLADV